MSESRGCYSRVYSNDMSPISSDSDGSELDTNLSPRPTTPQEDEIIMEELHSALGEALLEQIENGDDDEADSEMENRAKDQSSGGAGLENANSNPSSTGEVVSHVHLGAPSDKRTDGGHEPNNSAPAGAPSTPTRGNQVSFTQDEDVTTATAEEHKSQNPIAISVNSNPVQQIMGPNVVQFDSSSPRETLSDDSSSVGEVEVGRLPDDSVILDDAEEGLQDMSQLGDSELSTAKAEEDESLSSPTRASTSLPIESFPNYSIWGESSTTEPSKLSLEQQQDPEDTGVLPSSVLPADPLDVQLPVSPVADDLLVMPTNNLTEGQEQADNIDNEVPLPSPSRRLPVFASMAAEPALPVLESDEEEEISARLSASGSPAASPISSLPDDQPASSPIPDSRVDSDSMPPPTIHSAALVQSSSPFATQPAASPQGIRETISPSVTRRTLQLPTSEIAPLPGSPPEDPINLQSYVVVTNPPQGGQHFVPQVQGQSVAFGAYQGAYPVSAFTPPVFTSAPSGGRRKIHLRLQEDVRLTGSNKRSWFGRKARSSTRLGAVDEMESHMDRGSITVSWFEGTTSTELQEHVRKSVARNMCLKDTVELTHVRIIDESIDPPEGKRVIF